MLAVTPDVRRKYSCVYSDKRTSTYWMYVFYFISGCKTNNLNLQNTIRGLCMDTETFFVCNGII